MIDPIPVLDKGFVALIDEPNSDLKVVNAARVSFAKKSETFSDADAKLIQYLAKHNHWTPFAHCRYLFALDIYEQDLVPVLQDLQNTGSQWRVHSNGHLHLSASLYTVARFGLPIAVGCGQSYAVLVGNRGNFCVDNFLPTPSWDEWPEETPITLHMKMPIFVARQWRTSRVGIQCSEEDVVYNEVSRRYVDSEPEFHMPTTWRGRPPKSMKQGSDGVVEYDRQTYYGDGYGTVDDAEEGCLVEYKARIEAGVAPEQARIILPLSTYTEFWMTCSAQALARVCKLRLDHHAQWEVRQYAEAVSKIAAQHFGEELWKKCLN